MPPLWARPLYSGATDEVEEDERRSFPDAADAMQSLRKIASGITTNVFDRGSEGSFLLPAGTPRSTVNRHINAQRRFATQQFDPVSRPWPTPPTARSTRFSPTSVAVPCVVFSRSTTLCPRIHSLARCRYRCRSAANACPGMRSPVCGWPWEPISAIL